MDLLGIGSGTVPVLPDITTEKHFTEATMTNNYPGHVRQPGLERNGATVGGEQIPRCLDSIPAGNLQSCLGTRASTKV